MSYFRPAIDAMHGYVPGEQPQAGKFIKLNTNENPYPASPAVAQAVRAVLERGLERYPDPLATGFRTRAADVLGLDPDWILCGNGSDEILTLVTRAFVGEGQRLRLPMIEPQRVLELAERLPCPLLVDEAYADFAATNCLDLVKANDKIMVSRTLSKSYSLAGLRFGFLVAQPHIIRGLRKLKDSYNCDSLSIAAATAAVDDQAWLRQNRARILATRQRMVVALGALGFATVPSEANFVWNPHPDVPVKPLYERLKTNRILVRYMDYSGWGDGLRISVGSDEQIDACLGLLKTMV
jgi:histidinol-phosphate aminotransferase